MARNEGVIQFSLQFENVPAVSSEMIREMNSWRQIIHKLGLIGCSPKLYNGYGYGNISVRVPSDSGGGFLITGTQTGSCENLTAEAYAHVTAWNAKENLLIAKGMTKPSSEGLTHGQLYELDEKIQSVLHVHSSKIWQNGARLQLLSTHPEVGYGTVEMTEEVEKLFRSGKIYEHQVFVMGGHEDGVVSFGRSVREASELMITVLARALELEVESF